MAHGETDRKDHDDNFTTDAGKWADSVWLSDLEPKFTKQACGKRAADVRPLFAVCRIAFVILARSLGTRPGVRPNVFPVVRRYWTLHLDRNVVAHPLQIAVQNCNAEKK